MIYPIAGEQKFSREHAFTYLFLIGFFMILALSAWSFGDTLLAWVPSLIFMMVSLGLHIAAND